MNKFLEILLRIVIIVSFVCIIVFVCVAIINNQSIAYEGYNYIVAMRDKTNFKQVQTGIEQNVLTIYKGKKDPYINYINKAVIELNNGIDFFVDYLSVEDKLNKGEQDKLITGYRDYAINFSEVNKAYDTYMEAYSVADYKWNYDHENSDYAVTDVNAKCVYLIKTYIQCLKKGSTFFKDLVVIANKYMLPNISYQTYKAQSYMIKVGLVDYSLDNVDDILNEKLRYPEYSNTSHYNPSNNENARLFLSYLVSCNKLSDKDYLTNTNFRNFTENLNYLNVFEWAGNYNNYITTLNNDLKAKASSTKTYYNNNYR